MLHRIEELTKRGRVAAERLGEPAGDRDGGMSLQDGDRDREVLGHRRTGGRRRTAERPGRGRRGARVARLLRPAEELDHAQAVRLAILEHEVLIAEQAVERLGQRDVVARLAWRAPNLRTADPPELGEPG